jgi:hypothetical protein
MIFRQKIPKRFFSSDTPVELSAKTPKVYSCQVGDVGLSPALRNSIGALIRGTPSHSIIRIIFAVCSTIIFNHYRKADVHKGTKRRR